MKNFIQSLIFIVLSSTFYSQQITSVIRGTITDRVSQATLIGVNVVLVGSDPILGTTTDVNGDYRLEIIKKG